MKRFLLLAVAVAAILPVLPAHSAAVEKLTSGTHKFPVTEAIPCLVACSYWVPHASNPTAFVDWAVDGDDEETAFACTEPGPAGSYLDLPLNVPARANFLEVKATSTVDWDMFLCLPNNGDLVAGETVPDLEECPTGCEAVVQLVMKPARQYPKLVLRAYNWSDPADLVAAWAFYDTTS